MEYEKILSAIAPCGLSCENCFAHVEGDIRKYSLKLKEQLGNFDAYAKMFDSVLGEPIFKNYSAFKALLSYLSSENCKGCRNEQCRIFKNCGIRPCQQKKQVDFCFQCDEFPCGKTNFDESLYKRWVLINEKIRKTGIEKYYEKIKTRPRYV